MQITGYNSLQNINYNKNNANKSTNFKALKMNNLIKSDLHKKYHSAIDRLLFFEHFLDTRFKYWDLEVIAKAMEPVFILKSKQYLNEYFLIPNKIDKPIVIDKNNTTLIPCAVTPTQKDISEYEENIISNYDYFLQYGKHFLCLTYDSEESAIENFSKMKRYCNKFFNVLDCKNNDAYIATDFTNFPLYMLREFENSSLKKELLEAKAGNVPDTKKESLALKEADHEIISGKKSVSANGEKKGFAKVAGMDELKSTLKEDVILPLQQVELYKKYGIEPLNGIMLYGPPGTGKTFMAEALAEESGRSFFKMKIADTESKYVGETSKNIDNIFIEAEKKAPSIIFIDEIEGLLPSRSNLDASSSASVGHNQAVNTFLENMNNCSERGIFIITATNEPQKVDSALKRPGRIDKCIFVGPPDFNARKELFKINLEDIYADANIDYAKLASLTENYTAMEIKKIIIRQAALTALKQNRRILEDDIISQINKYTPQLNSKVIDEYRKKGEIGKKEISSTTKIGYVK